MPHVTIIGSGAASLQAYSTLLSLPNPPTITVLEALGRAYGRVWSMRTPGGVVVECGAEFIHGTETVLNGILESYNDAHSGEEIMVRDVFTGAQGDGGPIGVTKDGGCGVYYITCGDGVKRLVWWDEEEGGFEASNEACWEVEECEEDYGSLMEYFLAKDTTPPRINFPLLAAGYGNTIGKKDLTQVGFVRTRDYEKHWAAADGCASSNEGGDAEGGDVRLVGGTLEQLLETLVTQHGTSVEEAVTFNSTVTSIDYRADKVYVAVKDQEDPVECDAVIVTVPVRCLIDSDIDFQPPLPQSKRDALSRFGMEAACKLHLVFKERVWKKEIEHVIAAEELVPEIWFTENVATCFFTDEYARAVEAMGEQERVEAALEQLERMLGGGLWKDGLKESSFFSWGAVESIRGGYSYCKVGCTQADADELARELGGGRVQFAGEAYNKDACMTVHAAMESGVAAAEGVARLLRGDTHIV